MTKEKITPMARREANRTGKAMAVINLNPFSPLYVVREYDAARMHGHKDLVLVCHPETTEQPA